MSDIVSPARTRVLLALIAVYQRDGRATVRDVAEAADKSPSTTYTMLLGLRDAGFIEWTPRHSGTLRPKFLPIRTHVRNRSTTVGPEVSGPAGAVNTPGPGRRKNPVCEEPST